MRKLMIAMLALAVVFGFAACDNSTSTSGTGSQLDIAYIVGTEKTAQDYLVGETPDPADFTFTGYDAADNVVIENMTSTLFTAKALSTGDKEAVFTFAGVGAAAGKSIEVPVTVYEVESIKVVAGDDAKVVYYTVSKEGADSDTSAEKYDAYKEASKAGLTVTAIYNDGEGERVLDADDYTAEVAISDGTVMNWDAVTADKDYVVKVSFGGESDSFPVEFLTNKVVSLYPEVAEGSEIMYLATDTYATTDGDLSGISFLAEMQNGQTGVKPAGTFKYGLEATKIDQSAIASLSLTNYKAGQTVSVYATYVGTDVVDTYNDKTVWGPATVQLVEDKIVGFEAKLTPSDALELEMDTDYADGADPEITTLACLTVTYKMASDGDGAATGDTLDLNADEDGYTIAGPNGITEFTEDGGYSVGRSVDITVTVDGFDPVVVRDFKLIAKI